MLRFPDLSVALDGSGRSYGQKSLPLEQTRVSKIQGLVKARQFALDIVANVEKVIVGKHELVRLAATALLCQGHMLIDGLPGMGKTIMARSLAKPIGGTFKRIQGTPDLLPSDLTGVYVFDQRSGDFRFRPGPVMANIVLVDEINRASPRTQSALLECMEERQVTVERVTHQMPEPFLVLATRNPTEHDGTFPLRDTELVRLELGYPTPWRMGASSRGRCPCTQSRLSARSSAPKRCDRPNGRRVP